MKLRVALCPFNHSEQRNKWREHKIAASQRRSSRIESDVSLARVISFVAPWTGCSSKCHHHQCLGVWDSWSNAGSCIASSGDFHLLHGLLRTCVGGLGDLWARRHSLSSSHRLWLSVWASGFKFPGEGCATPEQRALFAYFGMSHQQALTELLSGSVKRCGVRAWFAVGTIST